MRGPLAALLGAWLAAGGLAPLAVAQPSAPTITGVEIVSPHALPEHVSGTITPLVGQPRLRGLVRDSLERLWALGLFAEVAVEEVAEPGGVRLRYRLVRRPFVRAVEFRGDLGLDVAEVADAAALGRLAEASPERLERARQDVLARYEREGFLGARVQVETAVDPATNGRDVTFVVDAGTRVRVGRIHVTGVQRLSPRFVRRLFDLDEGDPYRQAAVRDGVEAVAKAYRERGFFEAQVSAGRRPLEPEGDRVDVELTIVEGPHTRIEFTGVESLSQKALWERTTFADTRIVDEAEVRASALQVAQAYRERGYAFAAVEGSLEQEDDGDHVVRFRVTEGPRVEVETVEFESSPVPLARLREIVHNRPRRFPRRGLYRQDLLTVDAQALRVYLRSEGYPDATVESPRVTFSDDRRRARIVFPIDAGRRVRVGTVSVTGTRVFTEAALVRMLPLQPGKPWSQAQADEGRRVIERAYARRGFHAVEVAVAAEPRNALMDVRYSVAEGEQTRIAAVVVRGLALTHESVVRRELPFQSGDPLDPEALVEAQRRLTDLGLFDRVAVEPLRPPPGPFADVTVTLRERRPWRVDLGGGYSTYDGIRGSLELGHDNIFGTGRSLAVRERVSQRGDRTDLIYTSPWIFATRLRADANLFREHREEIGYEFERYGIGLGLLRELFPAEVPGLRGAIRYELAHVDRFRVDPTLAEADVVPGAERIATLTPELTLERRDRPFDPTRGSFHLLSLRAAGAFLGGDADFLKTRAETHWFFAWLPPTVVVASARLGLAWPLLDSDSLPVEERFFAGGSTTVRGYRENRLGPLDEIGNPTGGNGIALLNLEWRFPIWRWFGGAVFFDTGMVTEDAEDLGLGELKSGVGAGVRVNTPIGPFRLDAGYPLDRVPNQTQKLRFYLSIGHPF